MEKKLFVALAPGGPSLRALGASFWESVVAAAGARVISRIASDACDAYLLSESSLFVHHDRALLITCGTRSLASAEREIRLALPAEQIATMVRDVGETGQSAIEITVHDLDQAFCTLVRRASATNDPGIIRAALGFDTLFAGFAADDHAFQPPGYSLNALRGSDHCALHISLDDFHSTASLDTSWVESGVPVGLIERLLGARDARYRDLQFRLKAEATGRYSSA